eukprot:2579443-Pleurochrysis_carterae.AAC.1
MPNLDYYCQPAKLNVVVKSGDIVLCNPPFLYASAGNDSFTEPKVFAATHAHILGFLIGEERWTSIKGPVKLERRRWALVRVGQSDYMVYMASFEPSKNTLDAPAPDAEACIDAFRAAVANRKPGAKHTAMNKFKSETRMLAEAASLLAAQPSVPPTTRSASETALKPATANTTDGTDAKGPRLQTPASKRTESGIPAALENFGFKSLEKCSMPNLLKALVENGIFPPASNESNHNAYTPSKGFCTSALASLHYVT